MLLSSAALGAWALWLRAPDDEPAEQSPLEAAARPFLGLDEQALRAHLGPPGFRLAEPPGEYWRYTVQRCELDLFLYPAGDQGITVQHARYRPSHPATPPEACLRLTAQLGIR